MKKALIVVDYQNDFVSGTLGFPGAETLDKPIADRIRRYRADGGEIIFTFDTHGADYMETQEGRCLPVPHCLVNSKGHDLYGEVAKERRDTDRCFDKDTFGSSQLFDYLRKMEYTSIELCGLVLNMCVISNAIIAKTALPEAEIIIDRHLNMGFDPEAEKACYKVMQSLQMRVL